MLPCSSLNIVSVFVDGKPQGALASYNNSRADVAVILSDYQNRNCAHVMVRPQLMKQEAESQPTQAEACATLVKEVTVTSLFAPGLLK